MKEITTNTPAQISIEKKDNDYYLYLYDEKTGFCKACIEITNKEAARIQQQFNLDVALALF